ncbi:hypothetical protein MNBD_ALPHA06-353 [hydrothermal vent metagenome]|uniref:HTH cro/C1-type domain-containing protein n=1 Tax=hydrothermal vent metagenome TaxID=652676 RepID=A0A3B0RVY6_9ZZZZ
MAVIGHRIKRARKNKKFSQTELADLIGVTQPTIGNWESGHHEPRHGIVTKIADALDVRRLWLISGMDDPIDGQAPTQPIVSSSHPYIATPIIHIAVLDWPENAANLLTTPKGNDRYLAASLWALQPFALTIDDKAMAREFPAGSIVVFDAARVKLYDGELYLFNWNGKVILRRWHNNPSRLEPASSLAKFETLFPTQTPVVIARALQCVRDLA